MTADLERRVAELARRLGLTGEYVRKVRPLIELAYAAGKSDLISDLAKQPPPVKKKGERP